jgi:hypothetical protein
VRLKRPAFHLSNNLARRSFLRLRMLLYKNLSQYIPMAESTINQRCWLLLLLKIQFHKRVCAERACGIERGERSIFFFSQFTPRQQHRQLDRYNMCINAARGAETDFPVSSPHRAFIDFFLESPCGVQHLLITNHASGR